MWDIYAMFGSFIIWGLVFTELIAIMFAVISNKTGEIKIQTIKKWMWFPLHIMRIGFHGLVITCLIWLITMNMLLMFIAIPCGIWYWNRKNTIFETVYPYGYFITKGVQHG